MITVSLADAGQIQKARQILPLLGWTVVEEDGVERIEPGDQVADGPRQQVPALFDVDEVTMQRTLESGRNFAFEIPSENASLTGGVAWWGAVMKEFSSFPGGLAEAFERDPRLAKTYAALAAMPADAAKAVVGELGLRALAAQYRMCCGSIRTNSACPPDRSRSRAARRRKRCGPNWPRRIRAIRRRSSGRFWHRIAAG